jgi:uncharacterized coiled-coil protein SlyX
MSEENKKTATQRLEELEMTVSRIAQAVDMMAKDLTDVKSALKLLNNKLNSVSRAVQEGKMPTDDVVSEYMTDFNAAELKDKVTQMVASGFLVAVDAATSDSFVVINEADASGKIINPRMQFLVSSIQHDEVKTKLEGAKVGDNILLGADGMSINVLEIYSVATPPAAAPAATDAPAAAETPAAPAAASESAAS